MPSRNIGRELCERLVNKYTIILLTIVVVAASTYLHDPATPVLMGNWGFKYNDIVYGVFYPSFEKPDRWFSSEAYREFVTRYLAGHDYRCPAPYIDYKFEYPPVVGVFWYLSTCLGLRYARMATHSTVLREYLEVASRVHYYVNVAVLATFYLLTIYYMLKLGSKPGRVLLFVLLPSTLVYLTYNWDVIAAFFALIGLYEYMKKRWFRSGVFMGLSTASKLLTVGLAAWVFVELLYRGTTREKVKYATGFAIAMVFTFGLLLALSPRGLHAFITHHSTWYCENCLYMLVVSDIHSEVHRLAYVGFAVLAWLFMVETRRRAHTSSEPLYWLLSLYTLVVFNYVFSPQMMLMLTPLSVLLLEKPLLTVYSIADASNTGIILLFFKDMEVRKLLGLTPRFSPWTMDSPVQWLASVRNVLLLFIVVYTGLKIVLEFTVEEPKTSSEGPLHREHTY